MAMNAPVRFESLMWLASPMQAWAQAGADAPPQALPGAKPAPAVRSPRPRSKRKKALA
jgi:hypothetical protein